MAISEPSIDGTKNAKVTGLLGEEGGQRGTVLRVSLGEDLRKYC